MVDFISISTRIKKGIVEIYPKFIIMKSSDLMIRGGDFYAIWLDDVKLWSTDEQDALRLIDQALDDYAEKYRQARGDEASCRVLHLWDAETGMIDAWHKYCQKQMRDSFHMLDEQIIFSNVETTKSDYASKRLPYPLEACDISSYDRLMSVLYSEEERHKIEWAIGSIVTGDSRYLQKFIVFYGSAGTGKSTVLNIIQKLFAGYYSVFDAKALGSSNNAFALEAFKSNPLVAIQHDGDLSRIEDNTRLNSLVSHELMTVNEKFKSAYSNNFKCFLFMGTNKPVKITDAKSGLIRRLIDVSPTGNKLNIREYTQIMDRIDFELGGIADHCRKVFLANPHYYDDYIPVSMMGASNDFYNYVLDSYLVFKRDNSTTLKSAWEMYKVYCDDAKVTYPYSMRLFKEELKNYFKDFYERHTLDDGTRVSNYYSGFKTNMLEDDIQAVSQNEEYKISFNSTTSLLDGLLSDCPAQYGKKYPNSKDYIPAEKWETSTTKLSDLDTTKLHYVKPPLNHIVIDFDIPVNGEKNLEKNIEAASKWPKTYAELSKSGKGVHLHYIYTGDATKLSSLYDDHIEIKVFKGNSALRRKLTRCNDVPIATISSGLPERGEAMVDFKGFNSEKALRTAIQRNLRKEVFPNTKPSIDLIYKQLKDAYDSGLKYDVTDLLNDVLVFALSSHNQADYCVKQVGKMHFKSEEQSENTENKSETPIVFFDLEVFPNLFVLNWKFKGKDEEIVRMINPKPSELEKLLKYRLIGFNNRRYDNHILYAAILGYTVEELYALSQRIINQKQGFFGEAYNISYTDIYDFASAANKMSLKKLEIKMGIHHMELGLPWDKAVPPAKWDDVAAYCDNDVISTEAAFEYLQSDFTAREILAELAGMTVNDTTNTLTTRIIFGNNRTPQGEFNYRDLSKPVKELDPATYEFLKVAKPDMMSMSHGPEKSILPYFPGYEFKNGKSTYRGHDVTEGGQVYAEWGVYGNVALLDVASMHPNSIISECLFGPRYTKAFKDIVDARVSIKHEAWDIMDEMLDGKLRPFIQRVLDGKMTTKALANALKTAINSVYGLTDAGFVNPFRDPRNIDNIVAKRGALFMVDLLEEVRSRGFTVVHIKTDSIKIADATPEIIEFVKDFGRQYGYEFEHEATYEKLCLVNNAVYIAKDKSDGHWTATGTQFAVPYVFKTLFSHEDIIFEDLCETKSVTSALYLDMNENMTLLTPQEEKELDEMDKLWHPKTPTDVYDGALEKYYSKHNMTPEEFGARYAQLCQKYDDAHNYIFVGRVGQFCPMKPGAGGGLLVREVQTLGSDVKKYASATGASGYRWMESEMVRKLHKEDNIDKTYYMNLVDEARAAINHYADVDWFCSDEPYIRGESPILPF